MYILYGGGASRSAGPQMTLEEIGLPYELREVDISRGEHRDPAYLKINPFGFVPALITPEGELLHEAAAIMLTLADRHHARDLAPAPDDPLRARFYDQLFFQTNDIQPYIKQYFYAERYSTDRGHTPQVRAAAKAAAMERWSVLDRELAERGPYHLGDRFSLVDLHMAMWAAYGFDGADDVIGTFPAVRAVYDRVTDRPKSAPVLARVRAAMAKVRGG